MNGIDVSILIPSRNRPELLRQAVQSFLNLASRPETVEIIVRLHDDDAESLSIKSERVRVIVGDTAGGYLSLDQFVNCMAACCNGNWLWSQSDDSYVVTKGWDDVIRGLNLNPMDCFVINATVENHPEQRIPILSRGFYEVIGGVGASPHFDCYIDALSALAKTTRAMNVQLHRLYQKPCGPRDVMASWEIYRSPETARKFNLDKKKLGTILGRTLGNWTPLDAPDL